ncbi:family 43 glycosylhydrolase [Gracilibacillus oryzae]|uniref:Family 43 glycosylhydrolase n=1 Tax=Gracilibacillus oryzae TaxID=1672701 RepID=A0A7C8GQ23_9BACI|nr:glycoside hydrolase family 43 protein [Gracilibacillus oryzae]KAB8125672.1 family 43 glycosylhydrolase [Gracilibacillus oryzae]
MNHSFTPGQIWKDDNGKHISAHGGGILLYNDRYYWYGEDNTKGYYNNTGISCYSSTDLYNWKNEGLVLKQEDMPPELWGENLGRVERPKVIYNKKTGKFVMWMHAEQKGYAFSMAGVAVSEHPTGPFEFLFCDRPVKYEPERGFDSHTNEEELGNSFRDMTLFVDHTAENDGEADAAYVIYASEGNWTMYIVKLNSDYTWIDLPEDEGRIRPQFTEAQLGLGWSRQFIDQMREAPALFYYKNQYFMITSGCTGWDPNQAEISVSNHLMKPFKRLGDPCINDHKQTTFDSQSTFVLPVNQEKGEFIYMGDRWNPNFLGASTYVWLPLKIHPDIQAEIHWKHSWQIEEFSE